MGLAVAVGAAAAISVTTVLESVAVVGAVVGAVGAVTHNKVLSMVGLGLGLVGGVGALATSALGIGSAAITGGSTAGEAAAGTAAAAGGVSSDILGSTLPLSASEAALDPAAGIAASAASGAAPDIFGGLGGQTTGDVPWDLSAGQAAANPASGLINGSLPGPAAGGDVNVFGATSDGTIKGPLNMNSVPGTDVTGTGTGTSTATTTATNPTTPLPTGPGTSAGPGITPPSQSLTQNVGDPNLFGSPDSVASSGGSGMFSNVIGFVEKHPTLAFGALQAGGSLLSGMTNTLTPAQVQALQAQSAANNAAASLAQQQAANLAAPKAVASSAPVTGTPPLVPGQQGLINAASRPVTGVAA